MSRRTAVIWMLWVLFALSARAHATTIEYIHTDALGSIVAVTGATGAVKERREWEPYGEQLTPAPSNGPGYTGHVQDASTGLVYMQQRYYDPVVGRFLSVDPVTADTETAWNFNRYNYAANNPYKFTDPDGRLIFLVPLVAAAAQTTAGTAVIGTAVLAGGLYVSKQASDAIGAYLNESGESTGAGETNPGDAFPDRPLPRTDGGEPMPDAEAEGPHTQLGSKEGRNGSYPQAREFDADGKPVKDIDFTDHGRSEQHSNPHEHPYRENPTGGTRQRGPEQPLRRAQE